MNTKLLLALACSMLSVQAHSQSWSLNGNGGTTTSHFLGTTDSKQLSFRTGNVARMTIGTTGAVGIGIAPMTNSKLYTSNSLSGALLTGSIYSSVRGRLFSGTERSNGYLGVWYSASFSLAGFPTSIKDMGVLGVKEADANNGAGVVGWNRSTSTASNNYGVYGVANGISSGSGTATDKNIGVYGTAANNNINIGVYGSGVGTESYGGYFTGRLFASGRVGIGTDAPATMLHVNADAGTVPLRIDVGGTTRMQVSSNGAVGIGSTSTFIDARLRVENGTNTQAVFGASGTGVSIIGSYPGIAYNSYFSSGTFKTMQAGYGADITCDPVGGGLWFRTHAHGASAYANVSATTRMTINNDGRIAIGASAPAAGYLLSVDGKVVCEELKVQASGNWPDYVFADDYKLLSLEEVELHINEKGHLPGIPSAVDVASDGVSVGNMQRMLLEKVEELTLYIIDLEKKVRTLESR